MTTSEIKALWRTLLLSMDNDMVKKQDGIHL